MPYHFSPLPGRVRFDVRDCVAAIAARYRARIDSAPEDGLSEELRKVLTLLPEVGVVETDNLFGDPAHAAREFINAALAPGKGVADVLHALSGVSTLLPWRYNYEPRKDRPGLENRMAWAEFIGPEAPIHSDKVSLGVTLIGPHTQYPAHHHPAVESYFVLSGTATWTKDGIARKLPHGSFVLHPANVVHSMETGDEPLLAAYTWTGDIETLSIYD
jgi:quercetin dioxygenase-like cupin family protein